MKSPKLLMALIWSAQARAAFVTVDFANQVATSSNLMFGLSSWPKLDSKYAGDIADTGITILRSDVYLYDIIPERETFDKDPSEWNWNPEDPTETTSENEINTFKEAGLKHMLIIHGFPEWMGTAGETPSWDGFDDSLPITDYDALKAAYKEVFAHYADKIEIFQIANEPDLAMSYDDYSSIYKAALEGIKEVDATKFVGPQIANADPEELDWYRQMVEDPDIEPDVQFADWHSYGDDWSANAGAWHDINSEAGKDVPLFVSEWNYTPSFDDGNTINGDSVEAISYVGMKLSGMMDAGVTGSMLFSTSDVTDKYDAGWRHPFVFVTSDGILAKKSATFYLLSKSLGLGTGENKITHTHGDGGSASCSAINSAGQRVAWVINNAEEQVTTSFHLAHSGLNGTVTAVHYLASSENDARQPLKTETKEVEGDAQFDTEITLPPYSVYGVIISASED